MTWFWQGFDPQIQVIHSFIFQAIVCYKPYILSKIKSQHEDEKVENNEEDMMVEIDNLLSRSLRASGTLREKPSSRKSIREIKFGDKFTKNKIYDKNTLEVDSRAEKFLKMTKK